MWKCTVLAEFPQNFNTRDRGGSRTAATYKMDRIVIIINSFQPLTIITKRFILDVAAVLDPPLRELGEILVFYAVYVVSKSVLVFLLFCSSGISISIATLSTLVSQI